MGQKRGDVEDRENSLKSRVMRSRVGHPRRRGPGADRRGARTRPPLPRAKKHQRLQGPRAEEDPKRKQRRRSRGPRSRLRKRRKRKSSNSFATRTTSSFNLLTSCQPELD